jgi:hypothetical protein
MMKRKRRRILMFAASILLLIGNLPAAGEETVRDVEIREGFAPGIGDPIGKVARIRGKIVIVHKNDSIGYWAAKDLPLFAGDDLFSRERGRAKLSFKDGSLITLGAESHLTLTRNIFAPKKKHRSGFVEMGIGKVRFTIRKLTDFKNSEYKIKTETSVIGVRGSDFLVVVTRKDGDPVTRITTFEDTELEVRGLLDPENAVIIYENMEMTVMADARPELPERVRLDLIEQLKKELSMDAVEDDSGGRDGPVVDARPDAEADDVETDSLDADDDGMDAASRRETDPSGVQPEDGPGNATTGEGVKVPENEVVQPKDITPISAGDSLVIPDVNFDSGDIARTVERSREEIVESVHENQMEEIRPFVFPDPPRAN